jgi:hypothetical protein
MKIKILALIDQIYLITNALGGRQVFLFPRTLSDLYTINAETTAGFVSISAGGSPEL